MSLTRLPGDANLDGIVDDLDEADWQSDISIVKDVCIEFNTPIAVERSRSVKGGHVRNCIVLSLKSAHVESLAKRLKEKVSDVFTVMGGMVKNPLGKPSNVSLIFLLTEKSSRWLPVILSEKVLTHHVSTPFS